VLVRNVRSDVTAVAPLDSRILESYRYTSYGAVAPSSCTSVPSPILRTPNSCFMVPVFTLIASVAGRQPLSRLGNTMLWAGVHRAPHTGWDWVGARVYHRALRPLPSGDPAGYAGSTDEWTDSPPCVHSSRFPAAHMSTTSESRRRMTTSPPTPTSMRWGRGLVHDSYAVGNSFALTPDLGGIVGGFVARIGQ
jgi:hypothetical protein